jgi:hypothetical protein
MATSAFGICNVTTHAIPHALRLTRATRRITLLATICVASIGISNVHAIGLDEIAQQSGLGEPLRLVIPVLSNTTDQLTSDEFAGECFKLVPPVAGDLPQLNSARVALEQRGGRAFVVLTTSYPINEPIVRVAVQAGCRVSVSREYTVLLDPVVIEPPLVENSTETPAAVAVAAAAVAEPAAAPAGAVAVSVPESHPAPRAAAARKHVTDAGRSKQAGAVKRASRIVASTPPATPRAAKASARPRLQVSRTLVDTTTAPVSGAAPSAAAEREALRTIEEQTVVLQRQIAELSLAMERMQQELLAARAAKAEAEKNTRVAVERAAAAATSPWAAMRAWAAVNWPLLVLTPAAILLLAAALHRRRPVLVPAPITAAQAVAFNRADLGEPLVPGPEPLPNDEALVAPMPSKPRSHVIPPAFADPPSAAPEVKHDPELSFDYEVRQTAYESSAYSTLEREEPGIVGRLTYSWGTPTAAAQLENYLLTPRRGGRRLSFDAVEELKLLRMIALERASGIEQLHHLDIEVPPTKWEAPR